MNQVVTKLKTMIISENDQTDDGKSNLQSPNEQQPDSSNTHSSYRNQNEILANFFSNLLLIQTIIGFIFKNENEGKSSHQTHQQIIDYLNTNYKNTNFQKLREIINWLSSNQTISSSFFLFGYFNYITQTSQGYKKSFDSFNSFINASGKNHTLARYYVGICYQYGYGIEKDEKLAFSYYEKIANESHAMGQLKIGQFYENGIGIEKDLKMAVYWYEQAAKNENIIALNNLGKCYKDGKGVDIDDNKAFELFKKSVKGEHLDGMSNLGYCYYNGIGTNVDKQKAFKLYEKVRKLKSRILSFDTFLNEVKNIYNAIHSYEKSEENTEISYIN